MLHVQSWSTSRWPARLTGGGHADPAEHPGSSAGVDNLSRMDEGAV